jgi:hypothetical protein
MVVLPSGTVTFLFTDLERSIPLWAQHPDEMRVAWARHDKLLAQAFARDPPRSAASADDRRAIAAAAVSAWRFVCGHTVDRVAQISISHCVLR